MYLHLGASTVIFTKDILGIFDLDNTTVSKITREYIAKAQKDGRIFDVSGELPKSFVVCKTADSFTVYISQISASTLLKRMKYPQQNTTAQNGGNTFGKQ